MTKLVATDPAPVRSKSSRRNFGATYLELLRALVTIGSETRAVPDSDHGYQGHNTAIARRGTECQARSDNMGAGSAL